MNLDGRKKVKVDVKVNVGQHSLEKIMAMDPAFAAVMGFPSGRCISVRGLVQATDSGSVAALDKGPQLPINSPLNLTH